MLLKKISELRLTDPISIVLLVVLAGAIIGGLAMYISDRRKAKKAALHPPLLDLRTRKGLTYDDLKEAKERMDNLEYKGFFTEQQADKLLTETLKESDKLPRFWR